MVRGKTFYSIEFYKGFPFREYDPMIYRLSIGVEVDNLLIKISILFFPCSFLLKPCLAIMVPVKCQRLILDNKYSES